MSAPWSAGQITAFARDFARSDAGRMWPFVGSEIRAALIDSKVLEIVLGQDRSSISIEEIHSLVTCIVERLHAKPFGLWVDDGDRPHRLRDGTLVNGAEASS